jgi:flagellar hook assembly protein FlgD
VVIRIYDVSGREVRTLIKDESTPGFCTAHWDAKDGSGNRVPDGVYFYKIQAGDFGDVKKIVLLR